MALTDGMDIDLNIDVNEDENHRTMVIGGAPHEYTIDGYAVEVSPTPSCLVIDIYKLPEDGVNNINRRTFVKQVITDYEILAETLVDAERF